MKYYLLIHYVHISELPGQLVNEVCAHVRKSMWVCDDIAPVCIVCGPLVFTKCVHVWEVCGIVYICMHSYAFLLCAYPEWM